MGTTHPVRVVYCEGNVDGTIGGSYYSLLYLVKGLDRSRYTPLVVFHTANRLQSRFHDAGVETLVWPRVTAFTFGARLSPAWGPLRVPILLAQKAVNFLRGFLWQAIAQAWFLRRAGAKILHLNNSILHSQDWMLAARLGIPSDTRMAIGTEVVASAEELCLELAREYPGITFFAGKLIFRRPRWWHGLLHNETARALQERLHWAGKTMVTLPIRVSPRA